MFWKEEARNVRCQHCWADSRFWKWWARENSGGARENTGGARENTVEELVRTLEELVRIVADLMRTVEALMCVLEGRSAPSAVTTTTKQLAPRSQATEDSCEARC